MYKITQKKQLSESTFLIKVEAPFAQKSKPGNFVMLRIDEKGERIPLTIADSDEKTITMIFLVAGKTTSDLSNLEQGQQILDLAGPLGNPIEIKNHGTVALVAGGLGIAAIYPQLKALSKLNRTVTIIGARKKELLFFSEEIKKLSDKTLICTEDGSQGIKGFVTQALSQAISSEKIDRVITIGPVPMMRAVSGLTKPFSIPTYASINSIMVDGIGMCGSCRVKISGKTKFSCIHGPEFNAHEVDWAELICRNSRYSGQEKECMCENEK